ncbi:MAG: hypothetical protein K0R89_515 [Ramlibacter sp.]|nr:hypothetical protein [Ramlibacter sp.]
MKQPAEVLPEDVPHPRRWLGSTPLLDLEDPRLRLRVHALTQLCTTDRDKALALYRFVKRMPTARRFKAAPYTAREVLDAGRGDALDKAALLVAMLRIAGIPARIRCVLLDGRILHGLTSVIREADRPVLEVWLDGEWQQTDTYIYDADTMASARQRLKDLGRDWGYGIHVEGRMLWHAEGSAFVAGPHDASNPMFLRDMGCFDDPLDYITSPVFRRRCSLLGRLIRWNVLAPFIERAWRALREQPVPPRDPSSKTS